MNTVVDNGGAVFFYTIGLIILGITWGVMNGAVYGWLVIGSGIMGISILVILLDYVVNKNNGP